MTSTPIRRLQAGLLFAVSFLALGLGFRSNAWDVADQRRFEQQNRDMEAHVVARIVKTRTDGPFSASALLGIGTIDGRPVDFEDWDHLPVEEQFEAYRDGHRFELFEPYSSQIGAQGSFFALLDELLPGKPEDRLAGFQTVASGLTAATLAFGILWFYLEFGFFVAVAVLAGAVASPWVTVYGGKMFWSLWSFYLPMVLTAFHLRGRRILGRVALLELGAVVGAGVFIKTLFSGFEYITTALVMTAVPVVYYAVRHRWTVRQAGRALLATALGAGLAVTAAAVILIAQIGAVSGDPGAGLHHLADALERRTFPTRSRFPMEEGQAATVAEVLRVYLGAEWSDPGRFMPGVRLLPSWLRHVSFGGLLAGIAAASALLALLVRGARPPTDPESSGVEWALLVATWFSLLAPLSWFVVFKSHSAVHAHMAPIVWHMPFVLFGFAVLGRTFESLVQLSGRLVRRS